MLHGLDIIEAYFSPSCCLFTLLLLSRLQAYFIYGGGEYIILMTEENRKEGLIYWCDIVLN